MNEINQVVNQVEKKVILQFDTKINDMYVKSEGNLVLCSPDAGGTKRVKSVRDRMREKYGVDIPMVMIDKTRTKANEVDEMVFTFNENKNVLTDS